MPNLTFRHSESEENWLSRGALSNILYEICDSYGEVALFIRDSMFQTFTTAALSQAATNAHHRRVFYETLKG